MRNCPKCGKVVPNRIKIDGKTYNLQRRKYCLDCSPFKQHNTKRLHINKEPSPYSSKNYQNMTDEQKKAFNKKTSNNIKIRRHLRKKQLVLKYGGKCIKCNYDNNLRNLVFHHINPLEKLFEINAYSIAAKPWEELIKEADKCELLCHICHNDHHYPEGLDWKNWDI